MKQERFYELIIKKIMYGKEIDEKILHIRTYIDAGRVYHNAWEFDNITYMIEMELCTYILKDEDKNEFYTIHELEPAERTILFMISDYIERLCNG